MKLYLRLLSNYMIYISALIMGTQIADFLRHLRGFRKYIFFCKTLCKKVFLSAENNANQAHSNCLKWWLSDTFALIILSLNASIFLCKNNEKFKTFVFFRKSKQFAKNWDQPRLSSSICLGVKLESGNLFMGGA